MQFVIKIDRLGTKTEIRGLTTRDYISSSALPVRITMTSEGDEDRSDLATKLSGVFISEARLKGTVY